MIKICNGFEFLSSLEDKSAAFVFCDPPWGVGLDMEHEGKYSRESDEQEIQEIIFCESKFFIQMIEVGMCKGKNLLIKWSGTLANNNLFEEKARELGLWEFCVERIIWEKPGRGMPTKNAGIVNNTETLYWFTHEDCPYETLYWFNEEKKRARGKPEWYTVPLVWNIPPVIDKTRFTDHPCEMPIKLCERIIKCFTAKGELVVDVCAGSGVLVAVAKKLGRKAIGCEINPKYSKEIDLENINVHSKTTLLEALNDT
jgi:DNA modification methylase